MHQRYYHTNLKNAFSPIYWAICTWISLITPVNTTATSHNTDDTHIMDPVVVTATRSPASQQDVAANITIITSEQLDQMPATSVAEVLSYIPGISVQLNGGPGSDGGAVRIQGSEIHHVAIFQDGVPLNQLVNPRTDLSYLPLNSIERIEIYKGAASSAWGSALGGVINIITKAPDEDKPIGADAKASYGTHKTFKSQTTINGHGNRLSGRLSYTHEHSDGFIPHTDYRLDGLHAKMDYLINDTNQIDFIIAHNQGKNAAPIDWSEFGNEPFWDDIRRQHTYQRLLLKSTLSANMLLTLQGHHRQSKNTIEDVYPDRRKQFLDYDEELWGTATALNWNFSKNNTMTAGLDANWSQFEWKPFSDPRRTESINDWAVYANNTFSHSSFAVSMGTRYDDKNNYNAFSPSIGTTYNFTRIDGLIRAQIAKGFSAPDYGWIKDPTFGNKDLRPETVVNYQTGCDLHPFKWLDMTVNLFRANVKNLIRFDATETQRYQNIESVTRQGFEWALTFRLDLGVTLNISGSHTDVRDKKRKNAIQDIPRTQYNMSMIFAKNNMSHSLLGKHIDNNSSYPETRDKVFIFDYQVKVKIPTTKMKGKWHLYGAVYNLLNTDYLYRRVWPQPGRRGEIGVQLEF